MACIFSSFGFFWHPCQQFWKKGTSELLNDPEPFHPIPPAASGSARQPALQHQLPSLPVKETEHLALCQMFISTTTNCKETRTWSRPPPHKERLLISPPTSSAPWFRAQVWVCYMLLGSYHCSSYSWLIKYCSLNCTVWLFVWKWWMKWDTYYLMIRLLQNMFKQICQAWWYLIIINETETA